MKSKFFIVLLMLLLSITFLSVHADENVVEEDSVYYSTDDIENHAEANNAELFSNRYSEYSYTPSIFTVLLDPLFAFMEWILSGFPDFSYETSGDWFDEIMMIAEYGLWFFPSDLLFLCFTTISSWLAIQLVVAAVHFILKFIPFIGGGS